VVEVRERSSTQQEQRRPPAPQNTWHTRTKGRWPRSARRHQAAEAAVGGSSSSPPGSAHVSRQYTSFSTPRIPKPPTTTIHRSSSSAAPWPSMARTVVAVCVVCCQLSSCGRMARVCVGKDRYFLPPSSHQRRTYSANDPPCPPAPPAPPPSAWASWRPSGTAGARARTRRPGPWSSALSPSAGPLLLLLWWLLLVPRRRRPGRQVGVMRRPRRCG
jgi:hypothetical protein